MIEVQDVWKRYGGTEALRGVSLRFEAGRVTGLLGENGSGKSTLLRIVAGITRPRRGRVLVFGEEVGLGTRRETAFLPEIDPCYEWMRVGEQLDYLRAFHDDWNPARERELLATMKLDRGARVGGLSHGQRARLKIVAAFSRRSRLVVMDEPFNGIDPPSRRLILRSLTEELRAHGQTALLSTHLVDEVEELVEDVVYLRDGEVALAGAAPELRESRGGSLSDIFEELVT